MPVITFSAVLRNGILSLLLTAATVLTVAPPARAAFTGDYLLDNFVLTNINADGSWASPDAGQTLVLTGGNNGSGLPGFTHFFINAITPVLISFDYMYDSEDEPTYDSGGYLLRGNFHVLADAPAGGSASFSAKAGDSFGFGVQTADNWSGRATLTVTAFQVQAQTIPEPASAILVLVAAGGGLLLGRFRMLRNLTESVK